MTFVATANRLTNAFTKTLGQTSLQDHAIQYDKFLSTISSHQLIQSKIILKRHVDPTF